MTITGIVPVVADDAAPLKYTCPIEMLPVGYQVIDGLRCFKPLAQLAVEGLIWAGAEHIVFIVSDHKDAIQQFFKDGFDFGVPISYIWHDRHKGLASPIDAAYPITQGNTTLLAMPGITEPHYIREVLTHHRSHGAAMILSTSQNARVDEYGYVRKATARQMTGIFAWEPAFTKFLREYVIEASEKKEPSLEEAVDLAIQAGMRIKAMKLPYTVFVGDCDSWVKQVQMTPQLQMQQHQMV